MKARELFLSGELEEKRQLINLYLNKVVVYREHVEIFLNLLPIFLLSKRNPTQDSNDPCVGNPGGGEGNRTPVRKPFAGTFYERSSLFRFPCMTAKEQADLFGSFISSWQAAKLKPAHVHY